MAAGHERERHDDGNNGAVQNVVFDGSDAAFNGSNTRVTVPFAANLVPGFADVTTSIEINTTHQPGTGNLDFDLIRSEPTKNMYKVELFPHGKIKAQAQCNLPRLASQHQRPCRAEPE